jgi:hypothetical protein
MFLFDETTPKRKRTVSFAAFDQQASTWAVAYAARCSMECADVLADPLQFSTSIIKALSEAQSLAELDLHQLRRDVAFWEDFERWQTERQSLVDAWHPSEGKLIISRERVQEDIPCVCFSLFGNWC